MRQSKQSRKKVRWQPGGPDYKIERAARDRADEQACRVPWQRLMEARNHYVEMQEFYFWARSVIETEDDVPTWLAKAIERRCPGFIEERKQSQGNRRNAPPLSVRLLFWIQENLFAMAKNEGWFDAVQFYAIRDLRSRTAEAYWSECVKKWRKAKPTEYPSFKQWLRDAARCDASARLTSDARRARASHILVTTRRLRKAVARYIDWEAFAYWVRPALEATTPLPTEVARELARRCPGFLTLNERARKRDRVDFPQDWHRLMLWITDRFFHDAKTGGWMDAILLSVRSHPRAIRTREYWDCFDQAWVSGLPDPYPSFQTWRQQADSYVVVTPAGKSQLAC